MEQGRQSSFLGKRPAQDDKAPGMRSSRPQKNHPSSEGQRGHRGASGFQPGAPEAFGGDRGRHPIGPGSAGSFSRHNSGGIHGKLQSAGTSSATGGTNRGAIPPSHFRDRAAHGGGASRPRDQGAPDPGHARSTPMMKGSAQESPRHAPGSTPADLRQVQARRSEHQKTPAPSGRPGVASPEDIAARAAAAKKAAVQHVKQIGATGNFKEYDSLLGNYLIPVIPSYLGRK